MKRKLNLGTDDNSSSSRSSKSPAPLNSEGETHCKWTGRAYTPRYYEILRKRKALPVYEFRDELIEKVNSSQVVVVEGETGSGKVFSD